MNHLLTAAKGGAKTLTALVTALVLGLFVTSLSFAQGVTVNNLPNGTSILGSNYTICDQSGVTNKCSYAQVLAYVIANLGVNNIVTVTGIPVIGDCAKFTSITSVGDAGAACGSGGGGGTPGGLNGQVQYNNGGSFGGFTVGGDGTLTLPAGTLLVSATNGNTFTTCAYTSPCPVANGGTGTSSPGLVAGTCIGVTGSWPNQTITGSCTSAGLSTQFVAQTGNITLSPTNTKATMNATSGSSTATLPTAVGDNNLYCVSKTDSTANTVTITTTSSQTISGQASWVIQFQYNTACMASDNSNWWLF